MSNREGYPILYWPSIIGAFILLAIDLFAKGDQSWANIGCIVLIAVAVFTRPGGAFKRG